jgi:uncharacterized protein (DUF2132 family)
MDTDIPTHLKRRRLLSPMSSPASRSRDPLHGITLEAILCALVAKFGWEEMGARIPIRCFLRDPSVKSSLTFLRKTPWARARVEEWFVAEVAPPSGGKTR